jgi:hypothetical protein
MVFFELGAIVKPVIFTSYMIDEFELPVSFGNKELMFPARLLQYGYSYKIEVDLDGTKMLFEPDEERNWRAVMEYGAEIPREINRELVMAVIASIEEVVK